MKHVTNTKPTVSPADRCAEPWKLPSFARRNILMASGLAVSMLGSRSFALAASSQAGDGRIDQPATPGVTAFVQRAFEMRQKAIDLGDQAYGAAIVQEDRIVGQSWSRVVQDGDPTAHAELSAIRDAARRLNSRDLSGTVMYSSSRPCPMCEAAAYWAGIDQLVYGLEATNAGAPSLCR